MLRLLYKRLLCRNCKRFHTYWADRANFYRSENSVQNVLKRLSEFLKYPDIVRKLYRLLKQLKSLKDRDDAVIILTARSAVDDRIKGLDEGADDYLPKPFSLNELLARMHAIIRRKHKLEKNEVDIHGFLLNIQNRTVSFADERLNLTKKEFEIFNYLVLNKNRVVSRMSLTEHVWGDILEVNSDSNFVDVHVKNLRKKLSAVNPTDWFETVRSIGYRINC